MNKPTVHIKDAFVLNNHLYGYPIDLPSDLVSNTTLVRTSPILKHHSTRMIETINTMYVVLNWKVRDVKVPPPSDLYKSVSI